ncbi:Os10g0158133 [Oryza sativa Japonica Group]|uniref:Os10g0158133 protein n=1 Tax=Oryza sativa subsp. japonica TaxID=39947 RepID=A0A0P0XRQ4_ORYSJ|nr:Os10g0158133 [Oryza sativa Japonica Group]
MDEIDRSLFPLTRIAEALVEEKGGHIGMAMEGACAWTDTRVEYLRSTMAAGYPARVWLSSRVWLQAGIRGE